MRGQQGKIASAMSSKHRGPSRGETTPVTPVVSVPEPSVAGEPDGIVAVYAARAAARGRDVRPVIASHRAILDDAPAGAVARRSEARSSAAAPSVAVGRGTAVHRAAIRRVGPESQTVRWESAQPTGSARQLIAGLCAARGRLSGGVSSGGPRRGWGRKLLAGGAASLIVLAGAAGTALA